MSDGGSAPVGLGLGDERRSEATLRLEPGDAILLFTDGLVERRDRPLAVGFEQLADSHDESRHERAPKRSPTRRSPRETVRTEALPDDMALLVIRYAPIAAAAT